MVEIKIHLARGLGMKQPKKRRRKPPLWSGNYTGVVTRVRKVRGKNAWRVYARIDGHETIVETLYWR